MVKWEVDMGRSQTNKKSLHKDFRLFATKGDKILWRATRQLSVEYLPKKGISKNWFSLAVSNMFLTDFQIPVKFKHTSIVRKTNINIQGDKIEAYIYFLYLNYGMDAVKRYLLREYKRLKQKKYY